MEPAATQARQTMAAMRQVLIRMREGILIRMDPGARRTGDVADGTKDLDDIRRVDVDGWCF
jgi:hypothetical protein